MEWLPRDRFDRLAVAYGCRAVPRPDRRHRGGVKTRVAAAAFDFGARHRSRFIQFDAQHDLALFTQLARQGRVAWRRSFGAGCGQLRGEFNRCVGFGSRGTGSWAGCGDWRLGWRGGGRHIVGRCVRRCFSAGGQRRRCLRHRRGGLRCTYRARNDRGGTTGQRGRGFQCMIRGLPSHCLGRRLPGLRPNKLNEDRFCLGLARCCGAGLPGHRHCGRVQCEYAQHDG